MKRLLKGLIRPSTLIPVLLFIGIGFGVGSQVVPQNKLAITINGMFIAVWLMILFAYGPSLVDALRASRLPREQYLITGIIMIWTAIAITRFWSLGIIMMGKPVWMINYWVPTFCYLVAASSGFYFLNVPGSKIVGHKYWIGAIIIAIGIATVMLIFFET